MILSPEGGLFLACIALFRPKITAFVPIKIKRPDLSCLLGNEDRREKISDLTFGLILIIFKLTDRISWSTKFWFSCLLSEGGRNGFDGDI
jgi:hypothetical protein